MRGLIANVTVGASLFAAALFSTLFATGRLNHEGVANLPLLSALFPPPPAPADGKALPPAAAADAARGAGDPLPATGDGAHAAAQDAAHAAPTGEGSRAPQGQEPNDAKPPRLKRGRSVLAHDEPPADGGHASDHAQAPAGGHAEAAPAGDEPATANAPAKVHAAEQDFDRLGAELAQDHSTRYAPGGYFRFDGMPSGITADKLNEAWQRVQEVQKDLERRQQALDLRDKELRELADDIARRQTEVGKERAQVEALQGRLDERIERFKEQVKLVRTDEVVGLKRNAQTLASFEPSKAAELVQEQWKLEAGQDELLKTLEFMDKDALNTLLAALPNALIRDVLQKRLKISKEPVPPAGGGK